ncbi:S-methyl-5-thioribose-1-phosphate isomerase [Rhizopus microsporus var. microsporus]|uniref:Methylthioribose-1-phosphate isomerase n=2 Tax=Rhizopus microsporus TaxID=58291 RepID=A0A2G4SRT5_RHIZD|nr:Methylthioribose-1-phosphate isomerase [Rhizopus microsporus ATCC 52813]ORE03486.1 S-methyl-5-thioribose-1-phosphate isomerase [Rhizopus microsporus var. microsporus]PHZ11497.1 Methylthioribose-1-phosphate isomerase [Rhizopus microsporus ATCC 52813]
MSSPKTLEAIQYTRGDLRILNQLVLPHETIFETVLNIQNGHSAIKTMKTRGAPAIAIVAALSLAVDINTRFEKDEFTTVDQVVQFVQESLEYLKTSRPTAVNLFDAAAKLLTVVQDSAKEAKEPADVVYAYIEAAEKMLVDDVQDNKNIGKFGADYITSNVKDKGNICVLTHCNTGSLATAGWGTALGIIRDLHASGNLKHAYCTETRPYNQGSRLTAYELVYENIPATLICDNMASALLKQNPEVQAIVVGADRVAANGDTANKIGTYQLAITAKYHGILFIVAAPSTSIDLNTKSGADIVIEQRPAEELVTVSGVRVQDNEPTSIRTAAERIGVWNPSFDVTPSELISAIVTEKGVVVKKDGETQFDMAAFLSK